MKHARGEISFERVNFRYVSDGPIVLKGINLTIAPGETVALVGPSGGGKSSLVALVPRFYDVTSGQVMTDGRDVRDWTQASLRRQIGMVLQDNILFAGTVLDNILMGRVDATMEEVVAAAKAANAHEFIMGLHGSLKQRLVNAE